MLFDVLFIQDLKPPKQEQDQVTVFIVAFGVTVQNGV